MTDYQYDALGRMTRELGPEHVLAGSSTPVRRAHWTAYRDTIHERWEASGFIRGSTTTLINPVRISRFDLAGRLIARIEALRANTNGPLTATDTFPQNTWTRWSATFYDNQSRLIKQRLYHLMPTSGSGEGSSPTNYAETVFGYDVMGRRNRVVTPGGTITRTVFHSRGWERSTWVGTNDSGATDADPTGNHASGNDMVKIAERTYDGGVAAGDGHLTRSCSSMRTPFAPRT